MNTIAVIFIMFSGMYVYLGLRDLIVKRDLTYGIAYLAIAWLLLQEAYKFPIRL